jgi:hypothetical protein
MYAMIQTRPDIAFAVQWLSRQLKGPLSTHLNAAKNLLRYLNGTKNLAICYGRNITNITGHGNTISTGITDSNWAIKPNTKKITDFLEPIGFSDSDFAGDKTTSKSTFGYLFKVANGSVCWKSKRASTIALSTTEAETDALTEAIREVQWLIGLYKELQRPIQGPILLLEDNQGSITTAYNPALHNRTKHTLLKFRYVREKVQKSVVTINYLDTNRIPADGLTKPLAGPKQKAF